MGGICSTNRGKERRRHGFGGGRPDRDDLEYLSIDGRIILKLILKKWGWNVGWIVLTQDRDKLRATV
jgi:hypothetical protein